MKKPSPAQTTGSETSSDRSTVSSSSSSSTTPPSQEETTQQPPLANNEELSTEFLKQYNRLQHEGKEINPEELKIQNVLKETLSNPKTLHAARTQFARATGIGYSLLGGGVVLGLAMAWLFKKSNQKQE
ncbi:hypothetical protein C9374_000710 [Naegleria lovaniensis]|uniref:Uncharacterized protein n=1 Tax=Naegleria lovaniensis TaxID=51637 RepID=A0AA88GUA7_NAELO|nr:uncharacterized protein C9374_000710 [Naegleria lovaniensis]KAG2388546.1 hypothetical protein C9374_000710 [Naegleria lovaniensis]